jgi:hypothetical protein
VWQLARALAEIAIRQRGPDSLPSSGFLLGLTLGLYIVASLVDALFFGVLGTRTLVHLAAQIILLVTYVYAVLVFFSLDRRYLQTVSAIAGANVIIYCVFLPFALLAWAFGMDMQAGPVISLRLVLFFWSIFIEATIFARALSQPLILGFMFEILYVLPSLSISEFFAPPTD